MSKTPANPEFDDVLLSAYVDNELTADERAAVEAHLRTDERAAQLVADLRAASEAVKSLPRVPLTRDFRGSVLAAIERREGAHDAQPTILTLPEREREGDGRSRGAQGLVWTAVAIAAALLLMVFRTEDQQRDAGTVAVSSGEKKLESVGPDRGPSAVSSSAIPPGPERNGGAARTEGVARSSTPNIPMGDARQSAATPQPNRSDPLAASEVGAAPATSAALDAPAEERASAKADDSTSALAQLRTVELTVTDEAGVAAFDRVLDENKITLTNGELPSELSLDKLKEALPATQLQRARQARDATEALDATAAAAAAPATPTDAVLVEALPAEIDALIAALRRNQTTFYFAQSPEVQLAAKTADRGLAGGGGGGFGGGGGGGGFSGARGSSGGRRPFGDGEAPASRAWRLSLGSDLLGAVAQRRAPEAPQSSGPQTPPAAPAAAQPASRSGGELNDADRAAGADRIRVLFLLHRGAK